MPPVSSRSRACSPLVVPNVPSPRPGVVKRAHGGVCGRDGGAIAPPRSPRTSCTHRVTSSLHDMDWLLMENLHVGSMAALQEPATLDRVALAKLVVAAGALSDEGRVCATSLEPARPLRPLPFTNAGPMLGTGAGRGGPGQFLWPCPEHPPQLPLGPLFSAASAPPDGPPTRGAAWAGAAALATPPRPAGERAEAARIRAEAQVALMTAAEMTGTPAAPKRGGGGALGAGTRRRVRFSESPCQVTTFEVEGARMRRKPVRRRRCHQHLQ
jgi:hypothetical protein